MKVFQTTVKMDNTKTKYSDVDDETYYSCDELDVIFNNTNDLDSDSDSDFNEYGGSLTNTPNFITKFKSEESLPISIETKAQAKMEIEKLQIKIDLLKNDKRKLKNHLQDILDNFNSTINNMLTVRRDNDVVSNFALTKKNTLSTINMVERLSRIINIGIADIATEVKINLNYPFYNPLTFYTDPVSYPTQKVNLNYIDARNLAFWRAFNTIEYDGKN